MIKQTNKLINIIIVFTLIILGYFYWPKTKQILIEDQPVEQQDLLLKSIKSNLAIPPTGYNWQLVQDKDKLFKSGQVFYHHGYSSGGKAEEPLGYIDFTGKEWVLKSNDNKNMMNFFDVFGDYEIMADSGWSKEISHKDFIITSGVEGAIDSYNGGAWAYVKLGNKKLSVLAFGHETIFNGPTEDKGYDEPVFNCPCDYEYRVFLSDPVDIDSVLPK